jgi:hypothetical protein
MHMGGPGVVFHRHEVPDAHSRFNAERSYGVQAVLFPAEREQHQIKRLRLRAICLSCLGVLLHKKP